MTAARQDRAGPPRVVIDLERLRHINCGLGRFCLYLGRELLRLAEGRFRPVFFLPDEARGHFPEGACDVIPAADWRKEGLQRLVRPFARPFLPRPAVRLWHVTHQTSTYLPLDARVPVLLTIHDLNFLHSSGRRTPWRVPRKLAGLQRLVDRASAITAVSQFTAAEVRRHLDVGAKEVHVVPNGLAPPPAASAERPAFLPEGPFLLTVGNGLPHKNYHVLVDMLAHLPDKRLVIAGKKATPYGARVERMIRDRGLEGRVIMPGEVSDADRQWLYEHCEAFLFPSLAEGFGFPVLEAMQCGRPVFVSRATSLPEIAGDYGFFFESHEPASMAAFVRAGIAHAAATPGFARSLQAHAAAFTWKAAAERYAHLYATMLSSCP